jgi:hypothetical protein
MKTRSILMTILVAVVVVGCSRIAWKEFSFEDGAFSILMPGEPERQTETVETELGKIELTMFITELDEETVFFVSYSDYPRHIVEQSEPYAMLENARDSTIRSQQGELRQSYRLTLSGHPGLEYLADTKIENRDASLWARSYLENNRLFQILAMALKREEGHADSHEEMDRFLRSFRFGSCTQ